MTSFRFLGHQIKRHFSPLTSSNNVFEQLKNRTLIKIEGTEASEFLQGVITNDIRHLERGPGSMYTMFLNIKGRVLFDSIIYRTEKEHVYFIECDMEANVSLQKHLRMYKVRRKIDIQLMDDHKIGVIFNADSINKSSMSSSEEKENLETTVSCEKIKSTAPEVTAKFFKDLSIFRDPRVASLGSRIISMSDVEVIEQIKEIVDLNYTPNDNENYTVLRYSLGIAEGTNDLPIGSCLPLESNCDYLHGVSFHKGCYIGQELTARTYHTGVIRRRLMPLLFSKIPTKLPGDNVIKHENVKLGKLRGVKNGVGLAQLKISEALKFGEITIGDGVAKVVKPSWWPIEMSKEKVNVQKT